MCREPFVAAAQPWPALRLQVYFNGATPDGALLQHLADWLAAEVPSTSSHELKDFPVRLHVLPLERYEEAVTVVMSGRAVGKYLLRTAPDQLQQQ